MNKFQKDIIELVKCSLAGEKAEIKDLDYINVYKFSIVNQIIGLVFPAISKDENFTKSEIYNKFFSSYMFYVSASEKQLYELNLLYDEFNKNNINYIPLKGSVLKKIYPSPEMRTMGDADILVDLSQIDTINSIMQNLGYSFQKESDHELGWHKGNELHLELHKRLIPSYNKDYYEYYGDGWKIVKDNKIGLEDNFIFLFTHFAKHYRDKGVGLKYIVDFYVYLNKYKDLNFSYIETELKKLQLLEFYKNIIDTVDVWFNGKESTEKTEYITNFIFSCGVYGKQELNFASTGLKVSKTKKNVKVVKFFELLFLNWKGMVKLYPLLKKIPILLPIMYVVRWIEVLLFRRKNIKKNLGSLKEYSKENIDNYQKHLNYVGLDFNFKEEK